MRSRLESVAVGGVLPGASRMVRLGREGRRGTRGSITAWTVVAVTLALLVSGCSGDEAVCTLVGGANTVRVSVPGSLVAERGRVDIRMCDDEDCATGTGRLRRPRQPSGTRVADVLFPEEASALSSPVEASVTVLDKGADVARHNASIALDRVYPNGKECDGDGWFHGRLQVTRADVVGSG